MLEGRVYPNINCFAGFFKGPHPAAQIDDIIAFEINRVNITDDPLLGLLSVKRQVGLSNGLSDIPFKYPEERFEAQLPFRSDIEFKVAGVLVKFPDQWVDLVSIECWSLHILHRFLVEDDGPGLPEAVKKNIFQPVKSEKEGGSGIGLALSHQLAVSLGGSLELEENTERTGARFKLAIPVAAVIP